MSKDKLQLLSPLFLKYQADFEKNPRSRVFAYLAETYRKLGMHDKAMEILSQGIRYHPSYVMGYVGMAYCYYDLKQFNLAYTTLRPWVETNRDNLRMQRLFAEICLEIAKKEEALDTLKYLLFINPKDKEVAEIVVKLEKEIEERYRPEHKPIYIPAKDLTTEPNEIDANTFFDLDKLENKPLSSDLDNWQTINLKPESKKEIGEIAPVKETAEENLDHWNVKRIEELKEEIEEGIREELKEEPSSTVNFVLIEDVKEEKSEEFPVENLEIAQKENTKLLTFDPFEEEDRTFEVIEQKIGDFEEEKPRVSASPFVTHTLVDLYCGQGHIEKALEVLEKILILNPNDQKTIDKIAEIKTLMGPIEPMVSEVVEPNSPAVTQELKIEQLEDLTATSGLDEIYEEPVSSIKLVSVDELDDQSEEQGRLNLMNIIDEKLGSIVIDESAIEKERKQKVIDRLSVFLAKIQKRALEYQARL
jgi:tetratricopeptide (TPR) repeat protein